MAICLALAAPGAAAEPGETTAEAPVPGASDPAERVPTDAPNAEARIDAAAASGDGKAQASAGTLEIEVAEIPVSGQLYVKLHAVGSGETLRRFGEAVARAQMSAAPGSTVVRFEALTFGRYAARVFLDTDGDGRLDVDRRGVPIEPFGFSNDARGRLGVPRPASAAFDHERTVTRIRLRLRSRTAAAPAGRNPDR